MPKRPITRLVHGLLTAKIVLASATGVLSAIVYDQDDRILHAEASALNGVPASETKFAPAGMGDFNDCVNAYTSYPPDLAMLCM